MLQYWVWFSELKDISLQQKHHLLEQVGEPEEIFHSGERVFRNLKLSEEQCTALQNKNLQEAEAILRDCGKKGIKLLPISDAAYPGKLRNTPDAPILLYYKGNLPAWEERPFIGVVGTRKASAYGLQTAYQMGSQIAAGGGYVVSGGAAGADTAAMQGALEAGQNVICVLGCGVDVVYPRNNRKLFETAAAHGCLISEYPPGSQALAWHFPMRNRIISGISNGVLIVEAPERSGALITAHRALEQGRDVFVVPGNINTPTCVGSNALLQEGAIPVFSGRDVLREYETLYPGMLKKYNQGLLYTGEKQPAKVAQKPISPEKSTIHLGNAEKKDIDNGEITTYSGLNNKQPTLDDAEQAVLALLTREPKESAELIANLELPSGKVMSTLTMLTIKGIVCKHPGGRFSLK